MIRKQTYQIKKRILVKGTKKNRNRPQELDDDKIQRNASIEIGDTENAKIDKNQFIRESQNTSKNDLSSASPNNPKRR